jgi:hypothetical protein
MGGVDGWCMRMMPLCLSCHSLVFAWALYCQGVWDGFTVWAVGGGGVWCGCPEAGRLHKIASQIQPTRCLPLGVIGICTLLQAVSADLCVEGGGRVLATGNCESGKRSLSHVAELRWSIGVHRLVSRRGWRDVH